MNRFSKVFGIVFFGLIILIGIPGYYFVKNFDLNKYKSYASEIVENQTGRKLSINGDASIGISLVPTIVIEDVELSNPSWASAPQMIKVQKLELKFALMPLFKKQIIIDKVMLVSPQVFLEVGANGQANWDFSKTGEIKKQVKAQAKTAASNMNNGAAVAAGAAMSGFAAKNVLVENALVQYWDHASKQNVELKIKSLEMKAPSLEQDMNAKFDVVYNNQDIKGELTLGSLKSLMEGRDAYPIIADITAMGVDVDASGSVVDVMSSPRYAFNVNIYNPAGNFDAPETTLKARIDGNVQKIVAEIESLNIVNNIVTGKVSVDISGSVPFVSANLNSSKINLKNFSKNSPMAFVLPSLISEAQALEMVPATKIPYGDMKSLNAKAEIFVKSLIIADGMQADNVLVKANLSNGVLNVNPLQLDFGGGKINAVAKVDANSQTVNVKADSTGILLQQLHQEFKIEGANDFGVLQGGAINLYVDLSGSGDNYRQLVQSLRGQSVAIVGKSVIQTGSLNFMTGNFISQLLNAVNFSAKKQKDIDLTCAVVRTDFANGRAVFPKGIAINSNQLNLVSDGNINLINDKLDFSVRPFSGKLLDTNVAQAISSFIKVKGTVEAPKIAIDDKEALSAVVGMVTTGGTAYLGDKLLLDTDGNPCWTALRGTLYQSQVPTPSETQKMKQEVYQDGKQQIKKDIKILKDSAKDLLKSFRGM